jgi:hypothetical protein
MKLLAALSDEALDAQIEKQYERMRALKEDYWELTMEKLVRVVRGALGPEAGFLYLEVDAYGRELGLSAVLDRSGERLADWDSIGPIGKRFGAVNDELHEGFLGDCLARWGQESNGAYLDLDKRDRLSIGKFEERFKTL